MDNTTLALSDRPSHIPRELVVDFDLFDIPGAQDDVHAALHRIQQTSPDIFWTPRNGGHWVATRAEDIAVFQRDYLDFSNDSYLIPKKPPEMPKELPLECDPPRHTVLRRPLTAALAPREVTRMEDAIRATTVELIEAVRPRGGCEFITEIAQAVPISIFLDMIGLPRSDRELLRPITHQVVHSHTQDERAAGYAQLYGYLGPLIEKRRAQPGSDLLSTIVNIDEAGGRISDQDAFSYAALFLFGGLDTVASMLGFVVRYLTRHPAIRAEIKSRLGDDKFMRTACEELLRRHGVATTARIVTRDLDYKDLRFHEGEMVLVYHLLAGLDERVIDDPLELDLERSTAGTHAIFGSGPHSCPGSILARRELKIFLQEWLSRIPDFHIAEGSAPLTTTGPVCCLSDLQLRWNS